MREKVAWSINGYLGVFIIFILLISALFSFINTQIVLATIFLLVAIVLGSGVTIIQPNQAIVVMFFGKYIGSVRREGLVLTIPLSIRQIVSLRVRNVNSKRLKINDMIGNPIEIAAVIVFKVVDSAKAVFDVDDYEAFVEIQSETALRAVTTKYPYDSIHSEPLTLRENSEDLSKELTEEIQGRLEVAGVKVIEARLTHLAYSTEIAQAMLQRQQAGVIIAARQQIVAGAVGIVEEAIRRLESEKIVDLDDEGRVAMVNNLLVSIVSDNNAHPVIHTRSLYQQK